MKVEEQDRGNCEIARFHGKEAEVESVSPPTHSSRAGLCGEAQWIAIHYPDQAQGARKTRDGNSTHRRHTSGKYKRHRGALRGNTPFCVRQFISMTHEEIIAESHRLRSNIWALRWHILKRNARRLWRNMLHVLTLGLGEGIIY